MKIEKYKNLTIELYDSISELPEERFSIFNRFLLIDAGVGADLESFDTRLMLIDKYIKLGDAESCSKEIHNLRQTYYLIMNDINPEVQSFCCFVKSINGKHYGNTNEDIKEIQAALRKGSMPIGLIQVLRESLKKKSTQN